MNPHQCASRAKDMLDTLPSKWDPRTRQPEDYENGLMKDLEEENLGDNRVPFDRRVTTYGNMGQAFRIFTDDTPVSNVTIPMDLEEDGTSMEIATDGSCTNNGERNARAGAGVFVGPNHELNRSIRLPRTLLQSNQTGEMVATLAATTTASNQTRVTQITDSRTTMDSLTKWRPKHEDTGYILQENAPLTQAIVARLRMRAAHTIFKWVKGHDGHNGNEAADRLAAEGSEKPANNDLDLTVPSVFRVSGAKLQAMTQRLAYKAIRKRADRNIPSRPRTDANMDRVSSGILSAFNVQLHEATIWKSLRSKHVSRQASQFMWMALHDGYMLGTHWLRTNMSDELRARAICAVCGECETMSHVTLECEAKGQQIVWKLLKETWMLTGAEWKEPCWGTTFGAACAVFRAQTGSRKGVIESLWCILCTEALHLIWKLRCERVIQNEGAEFTEIEITNRYYATMDPRLNLDRRTAVRACGRKALKPQEVERIWLPILANASELPPKWVGDNGVLVGIKRGR